jgi:polyisoprenoid-binding protein YceI
MRLGPILALVSSISAPAAAEPFRLVLDPAAADISFTLGARLHTVRGRFALAAGEVAFDPDTGAASGEIRVDARSGDTGIDRRDRVMHEEVLDSAHHSLLVLRPERIDVTRREADALAGTLHGRFEVRGASHPIELAFEGSRQGARARVGVRFDVPWVAWGLPNPSNLLLRVDETLAVTVSAGGTLVASSRATAQAARAGRRAARPRSQPRSRRRSSRGSSTA